MKVTPFAALALLAASSTLALAQTASTNNTPPANNAPASDAAQASPSVRQQMITNLQNSGFTNVKVRADSFSVQAKDQAGNPVSMFITPNSMTEVADVDMTTGNAANASGGGNNAGNGIFVTIPNKDDLSSKLIGLEVYNGDNKSIGTIKDVAFNDNGRVKGYILSVGGFLGIGDHYVAVRPSAVNLNWNANSKKLHATMNASADQLKAAPEYKYAS